jgi:hypothetical protein
MTAVQVYEGDGVPRGITEWLKEAVWSYRLGFRALGTDSIIWYAPVPEAMIRQQLLWPTQVGHQFRPLPEGSVDATLAGARVRVRRDVRRSGTPETPYLFQTASTMECFILAIPS